MQSVNFEEVVEKIVTKDSRFNREAYFFLREALDHTQKVVEKILAKDSRFNREAYFFLREALDHTQKVGTGKAHKNEVRHVSGQELLSGIRDYALGQFGPMSLTVLTEWGLNSCEDFGEIVFNMVENNLLAKTEKDSREDFKDGYTFKEAFRKPFLPVKISTREKKTVA